MFFVTSEPRIFNPEPGVVIVIYDASENRSGVKMSPPGEYIYTGNRQECEDFVYAVAKRLKAVNPMKPDEHESDPLPFRDATAAEEKEVRQLRDKYINATAAVSRLTRMR